MKEKIRIIHLNDLHSHFEAFPKIQRFFEDVTKTADEVIKLDIGDNIDRSHPLTEATRGKCNVTLMNQLGIQYATIGNNEGIGLTKDELNTVYDHADFKLILNNLLDENGRPKWAYPYIIHETKLGTKIAFLASTFPYEKTYTPNGWQISDPIQAIKNDLQIPEVKEADLRILLSHLGIRFDEKITEVIDGIDLIIGSHTHHVFEDGAFLNGTYLAAAGKYGQYLGDISIDLIDHRLESIQIIAHETSHFASQKEDQAYIDNLLQEGRNLLRASQIGHFSQLHDRHQALSIIMDAMLDYANADFCIINSGLLVEPLTDQITSNELHESLPHQMRLVTFDLNHQQFEAVFLEIFHTAQLLKSQEIRGMGFRGKEFGDLCFKGFDYKNGKIVYNDKVMGNSENVKVVMVDQYYFASYFPSLKDKEAELLFPEILREIVEEYLKKKIKMN